MTWLDEEMTESCSYSLLRHATNPHCCRSDPHDMCYAWLWVFSLQGRMHPSVAPAVKAVAGDAPLCSAAPARPPAPHPGEETPFNHPGPQPCAKHTAWVKAWWWVWVSSLLWLLPDPSSTNSLTHYSALTPCFRANHRVNTVNVGSAWETPLDFPTVIWLNTTPALEQHDTVLFASYTAVSCERPALRHMNMRLCKHNRPVESKEWCTSEVFNVGRTSSPSLSHCKTHSSSSMCLLFVSARGNQGLGERIQCHVCFFSHRVPTTCWHTPTKCRLRPVFCSSSCADVLHLHLCIWTLLYVKAHENKLNTFQLGRSFIYSLFPRVVERPEEAELLLSLLAGCFLSWDRAKKRYPWKELLEQGREELGVLDPFQWLTILSGLSLVCITS